MQWVLTMLPLAVGPFQSALPQETSPSRIKADERVIFFPTYGARTADGRAWELNVHGWIFEPSDSRMRVAALRRLLGDAGNDDRQTRERFDRRARLLLADNERGKRITIRFGEQTFRLPPSAANGHFRGVVRLSSEKAAELLAAAGAGHGRIRFRAVLPAGDPREFKGEILLTEPAGVSVISDIDDTIKITGVGDTREVLRNTFLREFRAVPEMAELYRGWARRADLRFHYVSASPWHLFPFLAELLRAERFPPGTIDLKNFRFRDETFFNLLASPQRYKREIIESLLQRFPKRRFILLGDSSEKDPEIYADLARRHPQQIVRVLIRSVGNDAANSERYEAAFHDLPDKLWKVFTEPAQIRDALSHLPAARP